MPDKNIKDLLDEKFVNIDNPSKVYATMMIWAQCAPSYRRMAGLGQMVHSYEYLYTDECLQYSEELDPTIKDAALEIRELVDQVSENPPPYITANWEGQGEALTRDFLWSDAFEDEVYYDIRHKAREAILTLEARARAMAPPPGP